MPEERRDPGVAREDAASSSVTPDDRDPDVPDRLIAIVGPTAAGKTELAMRLAQFIPVEIIGADSRQVYRYMDIGTAKPSPEDQKLVQHHLVDIIDPSDEFSLSEYICGVKQANRIAKSNDNVPILVGGTGQYVMAVLEGWKVPRIAPDPELRARLEDDLATNGLEHILDELRSLDVAAWESVDKRNPRRVIRAIERARSGHRWGEKPVRERPSFEATVVGVSGERAELHARADRRFDQMMNIGFLDEVQWLLKSGYGPELPAMSGIGYSELADHLLNGTDLQLAVQRAKFRTHRYIRQQSNWFKASDKRITWFDSAGIDRAVDFVRAAVEESPHKA